MRVDPGCGWRRGKPQKTKRSATYLNHSAAVVVVVVIGPCRGADRQHPFLAQTSFGPLGLSASSTLETTSDTRRVMHKIGPGPFCVASGVDGALTR